MQTSADNVLERILAKTIDKQQALQSFGTLTEHERSRVLMGLRSRLGSKLQGVDPAPGVAPAAEAAAPTLKSLHEGDLSDEMNSV